MLKIVICENDEDQRSNMVDCIDLLIELNKLDAEVIFDSGYYDEMLNFINNDYADLYIMDIDLGEQDYRKNGFELAKILREQSISAVIIFISGYDNYMRQAFDIKAYHYLTKPVDYNRFDKLILEVYKNHTTENNQAIVCDYKISIVQNGMIHIVIVNNILYIEKIDSKKIRINFVNGGQMESTMTLSDIEEALVGDLLIRVHKSFICNVDLIKTIDMRKNEIMFLNGFVIPFGRTYKEEVVNICKTINRIIRGIRK